MCVKAVEQIGDLATETFPHRVFCRGRRLHWQDKVGGQLRVTEHTLGVNYWCMSVFYNADHCPNSLSPFQANEELAKSCLSLERTGLGSGLVFH